MSTEQTVQMVCWNSKKAYYVKYLACKRPSFRVGTAIASVFCEMPLININKGQNDCSGQQQSDRRSPFIDSFWGLVSSNCCSLDNICRVER